MTTYNPLPHIIHPSHKIPTDGTPEQYYLVKRRQDIIANWGTDLVQTSVFTHI